MKYDSVGKFNASKDLEQRDAVLRAALSAPIKMTDGTEVDEGAFNNPFGFAEASYDANGNLDEQSQLRRRSSIAGAMYALNNTDFDRLDEDHAWGMYRGIARNLLNGIEDKDASVMFPDPSPSGVANLKRLKQFLGGDNTAVMSEEAKAWSAMDDEQKYNYAIAHETSAQKVKDDVQGNRGGSWFMSLVAGAGASGGTQFGGSMPNSAYEGQMRSLANEQRRMDIGNLSPEERAEVMKRVIGEYEGRIFKEHKYLALNAAIDKLSDANKSIVASVYNTGMFPQSVLAGMKEEDANKVISAVALLNGNRTEGRLFGVSTDVSRGNTVRRAAYNLQNSILGILPGIYNMSQDLFLTAYGYAGFVNDVHARDRYFDVLDRERRIKDALEGGLQEGDGIWESSWDVAAQQGDFMVSGFVGKLGKGLTAARLATGIASAEKAAKAATKAGDAESMVKALASATRLSRDLKEMSKVKRGLGSAIHFTGVAAFNQGFWDEHMQSCLDSGVRFEDAVLTGIAAVPLNSLIEVSGGLESRFFGRAAKSAVGRGAMDAIEAGGEQMLIKGFGVKGMMKVWRERGLLNAIAEQAGRYLKFGGRITAEEFGEEGAQTLVTESAKDYALAREKFAAAHPGEELGSYISKEAWQTFAMLTTDTVDGKLKFTPGKVEALIETAFSMAESAPGIFVPSLLGAKLRQKAGNMYARFKAERAFKASGAENWGAYLAGMYFDENAAALSSRGYEWTDDATKAKARAKFIDDRGGQFARQAESATNAEGPNFDQGIAAYIGAELQAQQDMTALFGMQPEMKGAAAHTIRARVGECLEAARNAVKAGDGDAVTALMRANGVNREIAEIAVAAVNLENEAMRISDAARYEQDLIDRGLGFFVTDERLAQRNERYVKESLEDLGNGVYRYRENVDGTEKTVVLKYGESAFDEGEIARHGSKTSNAGKSYDANRGAGQKAWADMSKRERRDTIRRGAVGSFKGAGTLTIERDGKKETIAYDSLIRLANGRGLARAADVEQYEHERGHSVWNFAKVAGVLTEDDMRKVANAYGIDTAKPFADWEVELDEAVEYDFQGFMLGKTAPMAREVKGALGELSEKIRRAAANWVGEENKYRRDFKLDRDVFDPFSRGDVKTAMENLNRAGVKSVGEGSALKAGEESQVSRHELPVEPAPVEERKTQARAAFTDAEWDAAYDDAERHFSQDITDVYFSDLKPEQKLGHFVGLYNAERAQERMWAARDEWEGAKPSVYSAWLADNIIERVDGKWELRDDFRPGADSEQRARWNEDTRFTFILGEQGAANLDDNVKVLENFKTAQDIYWSITKARGDGKKGWKYLSREQKLKIKMSTGWDIGADGVWRYETADINRGLIGSGDEDIKAKHNELMKKRNEIVGKMNELVGEMNKIYSRIEKEHPKEAKSFWGISPIVNSDKEYSRIKGERAALDVEYKKLARRIGALKRSSTKSKLGGIKTNGTLAPFIKGMPVEKAYPMLSELKILFKTLGANNYGYYNTDTKTVVVNSRKSPEMIEQAIIHEVQHVIQHIEGWTGGANLDAVGWDAYKRNAGEVEARNAGRRTVADINKLLEDTEDVPREAQIIRGEIATAMAMVDSANPDIRFSMSQPRGAQKSANTECPDAAYADAVKRGDKETALRMIREAAAKAMPNTKVVDKDGLPKALSIALDEPRKDLRVHVLVSRGKMPEELAKIVAGWDEVSTSPYSQSYYNSKDISWEHKPEGSLRVANHWNFESRGKIHCKTDVPVKSRSRDWDWRNFTDKNFKETQNYQWALGEYRDGVYHILRTWDVSETFGEYEANNDAIARQLSQAERMYLKEAAESLVGKKVRLGLHGTLEVEDAHPRAKTAKVVRVETDESGFMECVIKVGKDEYKVSAAAVVNENDVDESVLRDGAVDNKVFADTSVGVIKSADITYDDNGELIPLSQRFNRENPDVRFSIPGIYTGSAADYERPSLHYVGTGEGAAVYGWGLYGSSVRGVAEGYASSAYNELKNRIALGGTVEESAQAALSAYNRDAAIKALREIASDADAIGMEEGWDSGTAESVVANAAKTADYIEAHPELKGNDKSGGPAVYEQTFFTNRAAGDESHLLSWYEPVSEENARRIVNLLKAEYAGNGLFKSMGVEDWTKMTGVQAYKLLAEELENPEYLSSLGQGYRVESGEQSASEFLARADIDGIKYPVDSYGKEVKDGNKAGWNYVSFRDDNIRVDHKWVNGEQRFSMASNQDEADAVKFMEDNGIAVNQLDMPMESGNYYEGNESTTRFSISAGLRACGMRAEVDPETSKAVIYKPNGSRVSKDNPITVEDVLNGDTPMANLMRVSEHFIGKADGDKSVPVKLAKLYCDILNQAVEYIDGMQGDGNLLFLESVWKWAGSSIFKSVKANGDAQYSLSVDMTTICKKTEQLMNVVSAFQAQNKRGATPAQMISLYLETGRGVEYDKDGKIIVDDKGVPVHYTRETRPEGVRAEYFQTPCPCCYVFSHWIRSGLLLETAWMAQNHFKEDLEGIKRIQELQARTDIDDAEKQREIEKLTASELNRWRDILRREQDRQEANKSSINSAKSTMDAAGAILDQYAGELIVLRKGNDPAAKERIKFLEKEIDRLSSVINRNYALIAQSDYRGWIKSTVLKDLKVKKLMTDFREVPADILFAYNRVDELVGGYPAMARFRTSKGSAGGKAVENDADNEIGEVIAGLAKMQKDGEFYNPFTAGDLKGMRKAFLKACAFSARQRLRGGQRIFSWSDNLIKFGPDMFFNFMQLQMVGASVQSYSKQLEGVELICSMGGYNNGSLIAYGKGYDDQVPVDYDTETKTWKREPVTENTPAGWDRQTGAYRSTPIGMKDADGNVHWYQLLYSKVQGIDAEKLFGLNNEYDRSGNIIVGMNEMHIGLNIDHRGIFFCIPWHASALKAEFLEKMMAHLKEPLSGEKSLDHTPTQGDGILKEPKMPPPLKDNATDKQIADYEEKVEKYKENIKEWNSTKDRRHEITDFWKSDCDFSRVEPVTGKKLKCGIKGGIKVVDGALSESQTKYGEVRSRILLGTWDEEDMKIAKADEFLSQIVKKLQAAAKRLPAEMKEDDGIVNRGMLVMQNADVGSIYPYEYWDETTHYYHLDEKTGQYVGDSTAHANGNRYLEYCRRLGAVPKFCGFKKSGVRVYRPKTKIVSMDYHRHEGFFKTLIDRRMYARDGSYQDTEAVDATGMSLDMITPEGIEKRWKARGAKVSIVTTVANPKAAAPIANAVTEREKSLGVNLDSDIDTPYAKAVKDSDRANEEFKEIAKTFKDGEKKKPAAKKSKKGARAAFDLDFDDTPNLIANVLGVRMAKDRALEPEKSLSRAEIESAVAKYMPEIPAEERGAMVDLIKKEAVDRMNEVRGDIKGAGNDASFVQGMTRAEKKRYESLKQAAGRTGIEAGVEASKSKQTLEQRKEQQMADAVAAESGIDARAIETGLGIDLVESITKLYQEMDARVRKGETEEEEEEKPGEGAGELAPTEEQVAAIKSLVESLRYKSYWSMKQKEEAKKAYTLLDDAIRMAEDGNVEGARKLLEEAAALGSRKAKKHLKYFDKFLAEIKERTAQTDAADREEERETERKFKEEERETGNGIPSAEELFSEAALEQNAVNLKNPFQLALFVEILARDNWNRRHGIQEAMIPWNDPVALKFLRSTAASIYSRMARGMMYQARRESAMEVVNKMRTAPTAESLQSLMRYAGEVIHSGLIRDTQKKLVKQLDRKLKIDFGAGGAFKQNKEEIKRKVSGVTELWARAVRKVIWRSPEWVANRIDELTAFVKGERQTYEGAGRDVEQSKLYAQAVRELSAINEFGALVYRSPGEIDDAMAKVDEVKENDGNLAKIEERERRTVTAASLLAKCFDAGLTKMVDRSWFGKFLDRQLDFQNLLKGMMRFCEDDEVRDLGERIVDYLQTEIQDANDRAATAKRKHFLAFKDAVESIYGTSYHDAIAALLKEDDRFAEFGTNNNRGDRIGMNRAQAMQLLVSMQQRSYSKGMLDKNDDGTWRVNTARARRYQDGQDAKIRALLSEQDLALVAWLGKWYEQNRQPLSSVSMEVVGTPVMAEGENYFPAKIRQDMQGTEKPKVSLWSPFPGTLTARVSHNRDFDVEADIISMWADRMTEGEQWKAFAKIGVELRGIFGRNELQEVIATNHGEGAVNYINEFITDILNGGGVDQVAADTRKAVDKIRGFTALFALGYNMGVMIKQTTSMPAFAFEIGFADTAKHIATAFTPEGWSAMKLIFDSEQRRNRWDSGNTDAVAAALADKNPSLFKRFLQGGMIFNKFGDVVPSLIVGQGIYRNAIRQGMTHDEAMNQVWIIVNRTQQTGQQDNLADLQRRSKWAALLYQFLSTQRQYLSYEINAWRNLASNPGKGEAWKKWGSVMLLNHLILPSLYYAGGELWQSLLGKPPDEDWMDTWVASCLTGPYASLFVFGMVGKTALDAFINGKHHAVSNNTMMPTEQMIKRNAAAVGDVISVLWDRIGGDDEELNTDRLLKDADEVLKATNAGYRDIRKVVDNRFEE